MERLSPTTIRVHANTNQFINDLFNFSQEALKTKGIKVILTNQVYSNQFPRCLNLYGCHCRGLGLHRSILLASVTCCNLQKFEHVTREACDGDMMAKMIFIKESALFLYASQYRNIINDERSLQMVKCCPAAD